MFLLNSMEVAATASKRFCLTLVLTSESADSCLPSEPTLVSPMIVDMSIMISGVYNLNFSVGA